MLGVFATQMVQVQEGEGKLSRSGKDSSASPSSGEDNDS